MQRFATIIDLHAILTIARGEVLLGERTNTGWRDGYFGLPSGHLEDGESASAGIIREVHEEVGVTLAPGSLTLVHVMHHRTTAGRLALFYLASAWQGDVVNREPDKCAGWFFFNSARLPDQVVPYIDDALRSWRAGTFFSEQGW